MMRVVRIVDEFMEHNLPEELKLVFKLVTLFFIIMWCAHLLSCAWYAIGVYGMSDTGLRWIDGAGIYVDGEDVHFLELGQFYQYTTSFHWATAQIALGGIEHMPANSWERLFYVLAMMVGFLFGSSLVSSLSASMVDYQMMQKDKTSKMRALRQYLQENGVDASVALPVQRQIKE